MLVRGQAPLYPANTGWRHQCTRSAKSRNGGLYSENSLPRIPADEDSGTRFSDDPRPPLSTAATRQLERAASGSECLALHERLCGDEQAADADNVEYAQEVVLRFEAEVRAVDPRATAEGTLWRQVIDDMRLYAFDLAG